MVLDDDNDFGLEDCARLRVDRQNGVLKEHLVKSVQEFPGKKIET